MIIELSEQEHETLVELLEERLQMLRLEIIHTDSRNFKAILQAREQLLESLHHRLAVHEHA